MLLKMHLNEHLLSWINSKTGEVVPSLKTITNRPKMVLGFLSFQSIPLNSLYRGIIHIGLIFVSLAIHVRAIAL